jgi:hypothetical protein
MGSEWILGKLAGVLEWIQLAQDIDRWRTLVNTVINILVLASRNCLIPAEGTEENQEKYQDSRSPCRDMKPRPPEYEAEMDSKLLHIRFDSYFPSSKARLFVGSS